MVSLELLFIRFIKFHYIMFIFLILSYFFYKIFKKKFHNSSLINSSNTVLYIGLSLLVWVFHSAEEFVTILIKTETLDVFNIFSQISNYIIVIMVLALNVILWFYKSNYLYILINFISFIFVFNGVLHPILSLISRAIIPGTYTSVLLIIPVILINKKLFK